MFSLSHLDEYKIIMTLKTKFNPRILRLFRALRGDAATWGEVGGAVSASGPWATSPFPPDLCPSMCPRSVPPMPQTATTPLTQRGTREVHPPTPQGRMLGDGRAGPRRGIASWTAEWLSSSLDLIKTIFLNLRLREPVGWYFLQRGKVSGTEAKSRAELSLVQQLKLLKDCARSWNSSSIARGLWSNFLTSRASVSPPVKPLNFTMEQGRKAGLPRSTK